jgi:hypothetical protein
MKEPADTDSAARAAEDVGRLLNRPGLRELAQLALRVAKELGTVSTAGATVARRPSESS